MGTLPALGGCCAFEAVILPALMQEGSEGPRVFSSRGVCAARAAAEGPLFDRATLHLSVDAHQTDTILSECASDALAERIGK